MKKIEFGNVLMQSPPSHHDAKSMSSSKNTNSSLDTDNSFKSVISEIESEVTNEKQIEEVTSDQPVVMVSNNEVDDSALHPEEELKLVDELTDVIEFTEESDLLDSVAIPNHLFGQLLEKLTGRDEALTDLTIDEIDLTQLDIDEELAENLLAQIVMILEQLQELLNKANGNENIQQVAKEVQKLFHLWSGLSKEEKQQILAKGELDMELEEVKVLRDLLSLFDKRNSFAKQQMYQMNSTITQDDVQKWLQQSLEKYSLIDSDNKASHINVTQSQPMQMTNIQQYTLHVAESSRIDAISRNLVSDLSNIVNRSSFLKQAGLEELTLNLRPHTLGDVTIRLAQVNGEMTVRFIVATEAAKRLFEANLHQIKPMFSPNNVVVERDMNISDEDFFQEDQDQLEEEQAEQEESQQGNTDESNETDISFEDLLQFLNEEAKE